MIKIHYINQSVSVGKFQSSSNRCRGILPLRSLYSVAVAVHWSIICASCCIAEQPQQILRLGQHLGGDGGFERRQRALQLELAEGCGQQALGVGVLRSKLRQQPAQQCCAVSHLGKLQVPLWIA